jgi:deoxyribose-phosphate aldolase
MENKDILSHVDLTNLKAHTNSESIFNLCEEALKYKTASVCVQPCYVRSIKERYGDRLTICTVIGFPLGYNDVNVKVFEAIEAIKNGADEIDYVINLTYVKNGNFELLKKEMCEIRSATSGKILKVIIETCYLTNNEKIILAQLVTDCGADFIKTSTGFGTSGANFDDVKLLKENIGSGVKIKASGGIRSKSDMEIYIEIGCSRLGISSIEEIK